MALAFKKATKAQAKLRAAIFGPSGAGKTFTALRIASGMGKPIAFIDTERGSASKYADRFEFDVLELEEKTIAGYVAAIAAAAKAEYPVLVIDSLTHGWQDLLTEIDQLAKSKYKGNTWSAWSDGTPKQRKLVDAILNYPGHVLATMRSKTEWSEEKDHNGRMKPVRVGLAPEQGKGIEYEFDMLIEMSVEHYATIIKDRTGKYQDKIIEKPGEDFGEGLIAWLNEGVPMAPQTKPPAESKAPHHESFAAERVAFCAALTADLGLKYEDVAAWCEANRKPRPSAMTSEQRQKLMDYLASDTGRASIDRFLAHEAAK
ncbi:MAG: hypothetical protein A3F76_08220 [Burkholderiales bacterium RIFCSPLOWO2_12_FULL_65_40]|nr:MAG: hypothetical protein A3F76_08220 [Burkholderiales bacterium RIFCSPLOWO2_12_FULL_65_40]